MHPPEVEQEAVDGQHQHELAVQLHALPARGGGGGQQASLPPKHFPPCKQSNRMQANPVQGGGGEGRRGQGRGAVVRTPLTHLYSLPSARSTSAREKGWMGGCPPSHGCWACLVPAAASLRLGSVDELPGCGSAAAPGASSRTAAARATAHNWRPAGATARWLGLATAIAGGRGRSLILHRGWAGRETGAQSFREEFRPSTLIATACGTPCRSRPPHSLLIAIVESLRPRKRPNAQDGQELSAPVFQRGSDTQLGYDCVS